jgi:hypothetical protein
MKLTNKEILEKLKNGDVLADYWKATRMFISTIEIPYETGLKLINSNIVQKYNHNENITYYKLATPDETIENYIRELADVKRRLAQSGFLFNEVSMFLTNPDIVMFAKSDKFAQVLETRKKYIVNLQEKGLPLDQIVEVLLTLKDVPIKSIKSKR